MAGTDTLIVPLRQERVQCPDGRKANKFYLSDQHNVEHLAVVGEESHARDGHYHYTAVTLPNDSALVFPFFLVLNI